VARLGDIDGPLGIECLSPLFKTLLDFLGPRPSITRTSKHLLDFFAPATRNNWRVFTNLNI
jgi:hypothetical protein